MIVGRIKENKNQILSLKNNYFKEALDVINNICYLTKLDDGIHYINNFFYFILTTYVTRPISENSFHESHRRYIDFQYIIYGEEIIGFLTPQSPRIVVCDYNKEGDIELYRSTEEEIYIPLERDMFIIFYPMEIHRSGLIYKEKRSVRKVIFKILYKE